MMSTLKNGLIYLMQLVLSGILIKQPGMKCINSCYNIRRNMVLHVLIKAIQNLQIGFIYKGIKERWGSCQKSVSSY